MIQLLCLCEHILSVQDFLYPKRERESGTLAYRKTVKRILSRGGSRILCKGNPEFCARVQNSGFSLSIHYYVTALPVLASK